VPAIYFIRQFAEGGLIIYGPDHLDLWRRASGYVSKILNGAKPAGLPVEQPTKFKVVINMKTPKRSASQCHPPYSSARTR